MAIQYSSGDSARVFIEKTNQSMTQAANLTDSLKNMGNGMGALADLSSGVSSSLRTGYNTKIANLTNSETLRSINKLGSSLNILEGKLGTLAKIPSISGSASCMDKLTSSMQDLSSIRSSLGSVSGLCSSSLLKAKVNSNNALSNMCSKISSKIQSSINTVTGVIASVQKTIVGVISGAVSAVQGMIADATSAVTDAVSKALAAVEEKFNEVIKQIIPDFLNPDNVNKMLPEWMRSVPSLLNKGLSLFATAIQGVNDCLGQLDSVTGLAVNALDAVMGVPSSVFDALGDAKKIVDFSMNGIKKICDETSILGKSSIASTVAGVLANNYMRDMFSDSARSSLRSFDQMVKSLTDIQDYLEQEGSSSGSGSNSNAGAMSVVQSVINDTRAAKKEAEEVLGTFPEGSAQEDDDYIPGTAFTDTADTIQKVEDNSMDIIDEFVENLKESVDEIQDMFDEEFDRAIDISEEFVTQPEIVEFITNCQKKGE